MSMDRRFSGRVKKSENGPGFVVETEMLFPTAEEASLFAEWIHSVVREKIASVGGIALPAAIKLGALQ